MKIYLFLPDELYTFNLPSDVSGSFSFDIKEGEEKKLINIEASQGKWIIYSTIFSRLIVNGLEVESQEVIPGNFYKLQREDESYLIKIEKSLFLIFKQLFFISNKHAFTSSSYLIIFIPVFIK